MEKHSNSPLGDMSPTKMFAVGAVAGILVLCTIGFFILLGIVLNGDSAKSGSNGNIKVVEQPSNNGAGAGNQAPTPPAGEVPAVTEDDHIKGGKNAKVTLIEYSDFECPFCVRFVPTLQQVEQEYGDDVRIVYRHFPLSFHPEATPSAEASECAAEQGKFWEFHDVLFENQTRLGSSFYTEVAQDLGLNMNKFNDCVSSRKYQQKVIDQQNAGAVAGVGGTPHTFVVGNDGRAIPVSGALPFSQIKATIDSLL